MPLLAIAAAVLASLVLGASLANATAPTVTVEPAEAGFTTAKVEGHVNPEGQTTSWRFQYVSDAQYQQNLTEAMPGFQGAADGPSGSLESAETVAGELTELTPNTTYHLRLFAENADGPDVAVAPNFTTKEVTAPVLPKVEATEVEYTTAKASGEVELADPDPAFDTTMCRFEYVTDQQFTDEGNSFAAAEPNGQLVDCTPNPVLGSQSQPVTVEAQLGGLHSGTLYHLRLVATNKGGSEAVASTFETKAVTKPTATIEGVSTFTDSTAHLVGHVDVHAPSGAVDEATEAAYRTSWRFECEPGCGGSLSGEIAADGTSHEFPSGAVEVSGDAEGLEPNEPYMVKLVAENAGGQATSLGTQFHTDPLPPVVVSTLPTIITGEPRVQLRGTVNPHNSTLADCRFDYGLTTAYGQSVPCENEPGAVNFDQEVIAYPSGLTPGATYHFRLLANNGVGGDVSTADRTFTALENPTQGSCPNADKPGAGFLPDCRAWEQASPVDKNGGDVMSYSLRTRASADGGAVEFASLIGFSDPRGTGTTVEYLAQRGSDGWGTHALTPKVGSGSVSTIGAGGDAMFEGDFATDFSRGIFVSVKPATDDLNVEQVANIYRMDGLRNAGGDALQLLSACSLCESTGTPLEALPGIPLQAARYLPNLAGASPDLDHITFESVHRLINEAPEQPAACGNDNFFSPPPSPFFCRPYLYEWDSGTLRLAGILPNGNPADASFAGTGAHNSTRTPHVVSNGADGHSRLFFTVPTDNAGNTVSQVPEIEQFPFSRRQIGNLYMREDHTTTVQLNASERSGEPDAFAPAQYLDASTDGLRSFFTTTQALTDSAETGTEKIYMYDASKPASSPNNLTVISPPGANSNALLGASDQGGYVYMFAEGRIMLWHDGQLHDIGPAPSGPARSENVTDGFNFAGLPRGARVTTDGRYLIFTTTDGAGLGGYDHGACTGLLGLGCREVYVYSADTEQLACASCMPDGTTATAYAWVGAFGIHASARSTSHVGRAISEDGTEVFFSTKERLVPEDTNNAVDAYVYDTKSGKHSLLSSGTSPADSWFVDISADADDAFITTRERLVGRDTDDAYDLYDARVGGGFSEPLPGQAPCSGETCWKASSGAPSEPGVGSAGLLEQGDPKPNRHPRVRCSKSKRKVRRNGKVRCVAKKGKRANDNRRAGR
jgi:hypothetical protein